MYMLKPLCIRAFAWLLNPTHDLVLHTSGAQPVGMKSGGNRNLSLSGTLTCPDIGVHFRLPASSTWAIEEYKLSTQGKASKYLISAHLALKAIWLEI